MRFGVLVIVSIVVGISTARADEHADDVAEPEPSAKVWAGQVAYGQYCASCHGAAGKGSDKGPPLVHPYYVASHHGDAAFVQAVRQGARAHHWDFGDMQPVEGVTDEELEALIVYVRDVQRANGLP